MTEQVILPCPACGIDEFYEHTDHRWCNACGFMALPAVWDRLGSQAARIAELEQALRTLADASDRLAIAESRVRDAEEDLEWPEGTERTDEEDAILSRIYEESGDAGVEVAVAVHAARKLLGSQP